MEDLVRERVKQMLNIVAKGSELAFAEIIGMKQTTLNGQLRGRSAIQLTTISLILSKFPDISAEWLLRGCGPMYRNESSSDSVDINVDTINGGFAFASGNSHAQVTNGTGDTSTLQARIAELEERIFEQRELLDFYRNKQ